MPAYRPAVIRGEIDIVNAPAVPKRPPSPSLLKLLRPYAGWVATLVLLTVLANGLNLLVP